MPYNHLSIKSNSTLKAGGVVGGVEESPNKKAGRQVRGSQQADQPIMQRSLPFGNELTL